MDEHQRRVLTSMLDRLTTLSVDPADVVQLVGDLRGLLAAAAIQDRAVFRRLDDPLLVATADAQAVREGYQAPESVQEGLTVLRDAILAEWAAGGAEHI